MESCLRLLVSGHMRKRLLSLLLAIVFGLAIVKTAIPLLEDFLVVKKELPRAEALVVMAGSPAERLPAAAQLFQEGVAPLILLTNDGVLGAWSAEQHRNLMSVEWAEADLVNMQIPAEAIVKLTYTASGSIYDALNARQEILAKGLRSIIIVTSDYHTRRALWTFARVLRKYPITIGVMPAASEPAGSADLLKLPKLGGEMTKYLYYRLAYPNIE